MDLGNAAARVPRDARPLLLQLDLRSGDVRERRAEPMKTYSATPKEIERGWYLIDAEGLVLGRLAAVVAGCLRGKHKPLYSPNLDCGDHVVVVNAEKVALTGAKRAQKTYYRHTGYPGGIKQRTAQRILEGAHPERVIEKAVERMLPKGALGRQQIRKLHVYRGKEHPHQGQAPTTLDLAAHNRKNSVRESSDG
jgi:large subunit ribosomal protein L13